MYKLPVGLNNTIYNIKTTNFHKKNELNHYVKKKKKIGFGSVPNRFYSVQSESSDEINRKQSL